MFLKQYNYKPRSNSQSSQGSGATSGSPPKEESKKTESSNAKTSAAASGRRRSSASGDKFAGLTALKRGSQDERRASWTEQKAGTGILGGMWQNFTKGSN
ncbi:hypothetical protein PV04_00137 [Phialophora macrospora]|uniref:Uncharacterized protein n=1 Tax=Phialophora macrospora TaxID=1851006 RepID=A0A0D2FZK0_9EURO|nr:hypothetical protein PV04_00137 [Phialophora macrospora]